MSMKIKTRGSSPARLGGKKAILLLALASLVGGCKHNDGTQVASWALVDPNERHPIMVSQQPATLAVHVPRGAGGLSPSQRAEVIEFANRFRASDAGNSRLVIAAPGGSSNEVAAMNAVQDVRDLLMDGGFSENSIAVEAYHGQGHEPPIRISYMRYVAEGPVCGQDWSENLARNPNNFNYPDFGCSNQRNLAAMVANPADLLGPRTEGPRNAERRDDVFGKYVKGKVTGSDKSDDERVKVQSN
ncbi:MAG: CpaD family pilus assembly protein [Hyphomicrobiaceae bacterium]|nr:CpaD family pilus assembly protein [Hyphomicrobiaceae bacterium]